MFARARVFAGGMVVMVALAFGASVGRAQDRVFTGQAGVLFHPILQDKTADFEDVITRVRDALRNSTDETRRAQAAGWKVYRAAEPGPPDQNSVLYVFIIDPTVAASDYTIGELLRQELPLEAQELYEKFAASYAYSPSLINLTLLADFAGQVQPASPATVPPAAPVP
ncbi:MAG: hypothetical protein QGG24_04975 [Vicinamibacterales bacterium]|nr:hypothetical protein [Vicinamibacterales bacterium]MDP7671288.1 hypothetical protein [Vicinamibacterales bacterium]HJO38854.1 hypothetical protein [Vicinamibacterales bacterium]